MTVVLLQISIVEIYQVLNRCEFIGNLGADPEVRTIQSGDKIVNLRVAVSDRWKDKNSGEWKEVTEWVNVAIFNQPLANLAERSLKKGSKVYLSGALRTRKWSDQSGNEKFATEVVLQAYRGELIPLDPRQQSDAEQSKPAAPQNKFPGRASHAKSFEPVDLGDEIPFMPEYR